ncbi:conserved hypothetical protein [Roseibium sp. TrichSKD4]|uniref:hypothetical protein n=1 Tax=Roseibium sp. TrichSKD4 TaxID=744980 RepID=UPI0001E5759F|nr:hypothetical protein [Roseibium sp. TrichSKD4]EFO30906.1 conserved hypothetical protein [Roseibium sp. TrichSKD4]
MTEAERMDKAKEWRDAAAARRDFAQAEIDAEPNDKPEPWWNAQYEIVESCWDRIRLIDALFPELGGVVDGKHT